MKTNFRTILLVSLNLTLLGSEHAMAQTITDDAHRALVSALEDERHAEAVYGAVIARFGDVRPFSNIIEAERRHQDQLVALFHAYSLPVPINGYQSGAIPGPIAPSTLNAACEMAVDAEIANRDLYDRTLLPAVISYPDITAVMTRLRDASEQNHLPAFRRCGGRR